MIRLPDIYYTRQMLDTNPSQTGIYQPPPQFAQGEDVVFNVFLSIDGQPLTSENWLIEAFIKKNTYAGNILWNGLVGDGIVENFDSVVGQFQIWLPAADTATFLSGTYYIAVQITEKLGTGDGIKDRKLVLFQSVFNIGLAASSPNPKLTPSTVIEVSTDIESGITTITKTGVEPTLPHPVDTSRTGASIVTSIIPPSEGQ